MGAAFDLIWGEWVNFWCTSRYGKALTKTQMSESYLKYDQHQYLTEKCQSKINNEISSLHSCHHSLLKIAIFKKKQERTNVGKDVKEGKLLWTLWVEMLFSRAIMENSMVVPQKIKNSTTIWSSNPTPEYISGGNGNPTQRVICTHHVHFSFIHNS